MSLLLIFVVTDQKSGSPSQIFAPQFTDQRDGYWNNFTYRHIYNVLSINSPKLEWLQFIYLLELEIKETCDTAFSQSFLDFTLNLTTFCLLSTKINYKKRDNFDFKTITFPFLCSNITASPAYGIYISLVINACQSK